jgi:hypothetical protein
MELSAECVVWVCHAFDNILYDLNTLFLIMDSDDRKTFYITNPHKPDV